MDNNEKFTNRPIDKMSMKKSKDHLWKFIESKTLAKAKVREDLETEEKTPSAFVNFFRSLFESPKRLIPVGVVAGLVIVAILFTNLSGLFNGGLFKTDTVHAAFSMTADEEDSSGVETDSSFTLTSSIDYAEDVIAENLQVSPDVEFEVDRTDEGEYEVQPKDDLEGNKVYNFSIVSTLKDEKTGEDKKVEYSWAYQIKDTFKITGSLPRDKATGVPVGSGIEINFSHENFDFKNAENYFEITPVAKGTFEKHRDVLVFVPKKGELKEATIHTVKIKKGFGLLDSDQKLKEDYVFQFETNLTSRDYYNYLNFSQEYYEISNDSTVAMEIYSPGEKKEISVAVYKYPDLDSYLEALDETFTIPGWCYLTKQLYKYDLSKLEKLGTFQALIGKKGWKNYIYLPNNEFEEGYYVFQIHNANNNKQEALVQITDLSGYLNVTLTDTLVWLNDIKTGAPAVNAKVKIGKNGKTVTTNEHGVAKFTTPEEWKTTEYTEAVSTFLEINSEDGKALVMPVNPYNYVSQSDKYWLIFNTDRPTYKPTDKVQFFGFIKGRKSEFDGKDLKLKLMYNWQTLVKETSVNIEKDGTFGGDVALKNYSPGSYYLQLMNGEENISSVYFEISDYVKPAYNLTVTADKNAVFVGETINYAVKAAFFEGTPVPNLKIGSSNLLQPVEDRKTNDRGELTISEVAIPNEECRSDYYSCYTIHDNYYEVYSKLGEEADITASDYVRVFDSKLYITSYTSVEKREDKMLGKINIKTDWVDLTKLNSDDEADEFIGEKAPSRIVKGKILEVYWERVELADYYDFIEKQVKKEYQYVRKEKELPEFSVQTDDNGEVNYEFEISPEKFYTILLCF